MAHLEGCLKLFSRMTSKFSIETTFLIFLKMCNYSEIITK